MTFFVLFLFCALLCVTFISVIPVILKCIETGLPSQTAFLCQGGILRYCAVLLIKILLLIRLVSKNTDQSQTIVKPNSLPDYTLCSYMNTV